MAPPAAVPPPSSTLAAAAAPASTTSVALAASVGNGNGNGNGSHDGATPPAVLKQPFIATRLNNFLHLPYVYDLSWYMIWAFNLLVMPLLGLFGLGCMLLNDLLKGNFRTERFVGPEDRAILITGCDSGFGFDAAVELALVRGYSVYAGCLNEKGMSALAARAKAALVQEKEKGEGKKGGRPRIGKLIPLQLDVTQPAQMDAAFARVAHECHGRLFALVNNAGVGLAGMVDWVPEEHFRLVMEVNFHAVVAACKRAIPLLQRQVLFERDHHPSNIAPFRPRIVNVTSFAGLYYGQATMGAYSASKHAAEAFSSSLRCEMAMQGIDVCVANPTFHATAMVQDAVDVTEKAFRAMPAAKQAAYGEEFLTELRRVTALTAQSTAWDPRNVCRAIAHAATAQRPRRQYILGMDGRFVLTPLLFVPEWLADAVAYWGSKRYLLKPAWLLQAGKGAAGEDDPSIRVIREGSDGTKASLASG